jgi:hypothetical protein
LTTRKRLILRRSWSAAACSLVSVFALAASQRLATAALGYGRR